MEELIQLFTKTYGVIGLLLIAPFIAVKMLWTRIQELQKDLQAALQAVNDAHGKRVEDAKAISERLLEMVKEHSELSKETNIALDRIGDMLTAYTHGSSRRGRVPAPE